MTFSSSMLFQVRYLYRTGTTWSARRVQNLSTSFQSPVGLLWKFEEDAANLPDVTGTIAVREYDQEARELAIKGTGSLIAKRAFTKAGLTIVELAPSPELKAQFPNWAQLKMFAIHDGEQMLTVSDENPLLWKAMLDAYELLRVKETPMSRK